MEDNQNGFLKGLLCGAILMLLCGTIGINIYRTFLTDQYHVSQQKDKTQATESESSQETELSLDLQTVNKKIEKLETMINQYYLDDIDKDTVEADLYKGLIAGLGDPYAAYYTESETKKLKESNTGEYYGIGAKMTVNQATGAITIVSCFEGTPAEKAGLVPEDILYTVNGTKVTGMELTDVVNLIKNSGDSKVHLQVLREGETNYLEFDVELTDVETPTVTYEMLANQVGYIKITEFDTVTVEQFQTALDTLNAEGMEKLVIDLRNNLGGVLTSCVSMLNQLLPEGIIVYTIDKDGNRTDYTCDGKHEFTKPLAVLVNGYSASASEIFTGAVKDYGIGTIVGTTTYGKGIVQGIYDLGDGTSLKLTKAKYYTPSGVCIHKTGIEPDVEIDLTDELKTQAVVTKEEDNQLQKALEILK